MVSVKLRSDIRQKKLLMGNSFSPSPCMEQHAMQTPREFPNGSNSDTKQGTSCRPRDSWGHTKEREGKWGQKEDSRLWKGLPVPASTRRTCHKPASPWLGGGLTPPKSEGRKTTLTGAASALTPPALPFRLASSLHSANQAAQWRWIQFWGWK